MISLPPGFDISVFVSDYVSVALPFVTISLLFATYKIISKALDTH